MSARTRFCSLAVCSVLVVAAVLSPASSRAHAAGTTRLLPDLVLAKPNGLTVMTTMVDGRPHFLVGFVSAAENIGAGPLAISGSRSSTRVLTMVANQSIVTSDG